MLLGLKGLATQPGEEFSQAAACTVAFPNACHSVVIRTALSSDASLQEVHFLRQIWFLTNLCQCPLPLYPFLPPHDPSLISRLSRLILECSMARHPMNREPVRLEKTRQETRCARRSDGLTQGAGSARVCLVPHAKCPLLPPWS